MSANLSALTRRLALWSLAGGLGCLLAIVLGASSASAEEAPDQGSENSVVDTVNGLTGDVLKPTTDSLEPVTDPVTKPVEKAAAPVTEPVERTVSEVAEPVTEPVNRAARPVTEPVREVQRTAVTPTTDRVAESVAPTTERVGEAVENVTSPGDQAPNQDDATTPTAPGAQGPSAADDQTIGQAESADADAAERDTAAETEQATSEALAADHAQTAPADAASAMGASASTSVDVADLDFGTAGDGTAKYLIDSPHTSSAAPAAAAPVALLSPGPGVGDVDHVLTVGPRHWDAIDQHHTRPDVSPG